MWTEDDAELALAWQEIVDRTCPGCGTSLDESTDPANERAYEARPIVCFNCRAIAHRQAADQETARQDPHRIDLAGRHLVGELIEGRRRGRPDDQLQGSG